MSATLILNVGKIITPFDIIEDGVIAINDEGKIMYVGPREEAHFSAREKLEFPDKIAVPGFIDIHIHGAAGVDTMDGKYESLLKMSKFLVSHGVTAFLPTTVTSPLEDIFKALDAIRETRRRGTGYAKILGAHVEGPYFSKEKAGAQDARYLREPKIEEIKYILNNYGDIIVRFTLAPELPNALEAIRYLSGKGILVAMGHTNAKYEEAIKAINAGAKLANHMYNGMRGFHHRDPGIIGAVLTRDDVYVEIIIDEVHHHNAAREIVIRCKGVNRTILITDSIMAAGLPDGEYTLGRQKIIIKNGISRLPDGTIAGSTLTLDRAIKNTVEYLRVPLPDAVRMATFVPAEVLGISHKMGAIKEGYNADITVLNKDLTVAMTLVDGKIVYSASK
mgnify:CR=1 FL=1